jgi:hypothetical protein
MLRHYVSALGHRNWVDCLATAEFAINNSFHESIGTTPFRLNFGRDPRVPLSVPPSTVPSAAQFADRMAEGLEQAKRCLRSAQDRQKLYYDGRRRHVVFQEGEEVLLSTKNIHLKSKGEKGSSQKLMPKFIGPFKILKKVGNDAYKLDLPDHKKLHPVFHVSLLKPYRHDDTPGRVQPPPEPVEVDDQVEFFVDFIVSHKGVKAGKRKFKIRWQGYGLEWDEWLPETEVCNTAAYSRYIREHGITPLVRDSDDDE